MMTSRDHYTIRSIHVGSEPDIKTGAVVPDLSVATTYKQHGVGKHTGFEYSRSANPTRSALESVLTSLETGDTLSGDTGGDTLAFASGLAATAAVCRWVSLAADEGGAGGTDGRTGGGGHILAVNDVYGGTARYLSRTAKSTGLEVTYLDFEKAGEEGIRAAIRPDTRVIWLEIPTNPLLLVPPLPLIASTVHSLPKPPLILIDTTFLSSFYITPLVPISGVPLADVVLSSLSKYSGGHSDIILGSLTLSARTVSSRPNLRQGLRFLHNASGGVPSPRDCHLMIRSLKTLGLRALRHGMNALRISSWLSSRSEVSNVRYPGLHTDGAFHIVEQVLSPNARKELEFLGWQFPFRPSDIPASHTLEYLRSLGIPFGGIISFRIQNASAEATEKFVTSLRLIILAESLGGVESLIEIPAGMTHAGLPEATRSALGITDNLVRLSVGIEDVEDLIADLQQALSG